MGRIDENKRKKQSDLMDTALKLFTQQGVTRTSISDIAARAGVAKGTFYLYFRDKYDLNERLVVHESEKLFQHALEHSGYQELPDAQEKLLAIVDDVLDQLRENTLLLRFINKNLSWGIFRRAIDRSDTDYRAVFERLLGAELPEREILDMEIYTIMELVGSTCYSVILEGEPADLDSFRPYLHRSIRAILDSFQG